MVVPVVYENGVFRPLAPVDLPEGARFELDIENSQKAAQQANEPDWSWRSLGQVVSVSDDFDETPPEFEEYEG